MPWTASRCTTRGVYRSSCGCQLRFRINVGVFFPRCYRCRDFVEWTLVDEPPSEDGVFSEPPVAPSGKLSPGRRS